MSTDVTLDGRIGSKPPELRFTPAGKAVATFDMVTSRRVKNDDGTWSDADATWYRVDCWDQMAENVAESLNAGDAVLVRGRMHVERWERDGAKGSTLKVTAWSIGPNLRWATAKVFRASRTTASHDDYAPPIGGGRTDTRQEARQAAVDDPWATPLSAGKDAPF